MATRMPGRGWRVDERQDRPIPSPAAGLKPTTPGASAPQPPKDTPLLHFATSDPQADLEAVRDTRGPQPRIRHAFLTQENDSGGGAARGSSPAGPGPTGKPTPAPAIAPRASCEAGEALWRLTFRPVGADMGQAVQRVRRLLKAALRGYGLRCTRVEEVGPAGGEADPAEQVAQRAAQVTRRKDR